MIHEIKPKKYNNQFRNRKASSDDYVMCFKDNKVVLKLDMTFFRVKDEEFTDLQFLFSIDNEDFFLTKDVKSEHVLETIQIFRHYLPTYLGYAGACAFSLNRWYSNNVYCGRCGSLTKHSENERALVCSCGNIIYPKIAPAVIVGIINDGKILCTKYNAKASSYRKYALVAGFNEIGESIEETVIREVKEEVGLNVKDLIYYNSQPWPFTDSLLMGFFCKVDGSDLIELDENELQEAKWFKPEELNEVYDNVSLTHKMIEEFKIGNVK